MHFPETVDKIGFIQYNLIKKFFQKKCNEL